ncbi:unnamed protein product [Sphenostylis stenocarpa]|uniref:Uncharacterized protein n=1 Tax=Sphenostylis stenocarpa TaxID=92480 RepID=A0AA86RKS2_9FABA|nr:unnamed protein product [Sphenostylis stenocarpa]
MFKSYQHQQKEEFMRLSDRFNDCLVKLAICRTLTNEGVVITAIGRFLLHGIRLVFGFGAMFGVLMSRGAERFQCPKPGHHRSCHKQAPTKETAPPQDQPTLANN